MDAASLNYAVLAQGHRCGEPIEVSPADIKGHRATERTAKKGMRLQSQIGLLNTSPARPFNCAVCSGAVGDKWFGGECA